MRILVLGQGKTGKLVAEVAAERGHGVHVLDELENVRAGALTPPFVAGFDVVSEYPSAEHPRLRPPQPASSQLFSTRGAPGLNSVRHRVAPGPAAASETLEHADAGPRLLRAPARGWAPQQGVDA